MSCSINTNIGILSGLSLQLYCTFPLKRDFHGIRYSLFGIVTRLRVVPSGIQTSAWQRDFLFPTISRPVLEPNQPPIQWVTEFFSRLNPQGHEADHSFPSSAGVKNEWIYVFPLFAFTAWTGSNLALQYFRNKQLILFSAGRHLDN
jgi:hypothetical protein